MTSETRFVILPEPKLKGEVSLEQALKKRRSIRNYSGKFISLNDLSQLLWAGQGITTIDGKRTSPSAGGLFPFELYTMVGNVSLIETGIYKYHQDNHTLEFKMSGDKRDEIADAALGQESLLQCAVAIIITADISKTARKYGDRAERYVFMEAGHISQNIYLQATAMNLGTVAIGAFFDDRVKKILKLPVNFQPLYIMPVGIS